MEPLVSILVFTAGMIVGGAAIGLLLRAATATERTTLQKALETARGEAVQLREETRTATEKRIAAEERSARANELQTQIEQRDASIVKLQTELTKAQSSQAELTGRLDEQARTAGEKLAMIESAQTRLTDSFKAIAAEVLQGNNKAFLDLANSNLGSFQEGAKGDLALRQQAIDELARPIRESLEKVDAKVQQLETSRAAAYAGLTEQVSLLRATQEQLHSQTVNLVSALRAPAVRGRWGEVQLRRVVELAGMIEYCDFEQQPTVGSDEGRLRPDMVVKLPNRRQVVIDSKVSLKAYLEALDATDEPTRVAKLKEHAAQVRTHLTRLADKSYWRQFPDTPEFVVAFLPGEIFFSAALEQDPTLIEYGAEQGVVLATPTTLIALLKAVAYGWRQETIAQHAQEISDLGRILYERIQRFAEQLDRLRDTIRRTVDAFNEAAGSMESRVLVSARRFKELGAFTGGDIAVLQSIDAVPRALQSIELATKAADREPVAPQAGL